MLRGDAGGRERPEPLAELARLTRMGWHAERRAMVLEGELARLQARTVRAPSAAHVLETEARESEAAAQAAIAGERDRARAETAAVATELAAARAQLGRGRVRAALRAGAILDRLRRRA